MIHIYLCEGCVEKVCLSIGESSCQVLRFGPCESSPEKGRVDTSGQGCAKKINISVLKSSGEKLRSGLHQGGGQKRGISSS